MASNRMAAVSISSDLKRPMSRTRQQQALATDGGYRHLWQFGHQKRSRSWPGGPCSPLLIGVPQRRQGRPARPYTQLS
jgi:hypothetical protein